MSTPFPVVSVLLLAVVALVEIGRRWVLRKYGQLPLIGSKLGEALPAGVPKPFDTVVVIGGSLAGLMTAGTLSPLAKKVVIMERHKNPGIVDDFEDRDQVASFAPQGRQIHVYQVRGFEVMNKVFPNLGKDYAAAGMLPLDIRRQAYWDSIGGVRPHCPIGGAMTYLGRREVIEACARNRVMKLENVEFVWESTVTGLINEGDVIKGVTLKKEKGAEENFSADLVIDCGGQTTQSPLWLKKCGFPVETYEILLRLQYLSGEFLFRKTSESELTKRIIHYYQGVLPERTLAFLMLRLSEPDEEGNLKYLVTCQAIGGDTKFDQPYTWENLEEFVSERLPVCKELEYQSTIMPFNEFKKRGSKWNQFEKTGIKNFIALGDSAISFNPVYGQGISTAAESIVLFNHCLRTMGNSPQLAPTFQAKLKDAMTVPWIISTMNELQFAESKHSSLARGISWLGGLLMRELLKATKVDMWLLDRFYATMGMEEGYFTDMLSPSFAARVMFPQTSK